MLLEAFHFDLCSEEMSVGRVRPYALLGRPDWDEAAKTLGPIKLGRVRGQWTLSMTRYRGKNHTTTPTVLMKNASRPMSHAGGESAHFPDEITEVQQLE